MAQCWGEGVGEISQNRDERSWPDARMSESVHLKPEMKCANTAFPGNPLLNLTITYKQHSLSFDGHGFEFGGKGGRQHFIIKEFTQKILSFIIMAVLGVQK